ncbi:MAG: hypothetical protein DRI57_03050 [Deltaproteobacteria bacterium]|nr:MAG: hypothetical protein DRI57_03050 [Deltaproteobacteria bacterium]
MKKWRIQMKKANKYLTGQRLFVVCFSTLILLSVFALSGEALNGYLHIQVTPEIKSLLTIEDENGNETRVVVPEDGYYITSLPSGEVILTLKAEGFLTYTTSVFVKETVPTTLNITLTPDRNFKFIIVAGGTPSEENSIWKATRKSGENAYQTLIQLGYPKEDIYYFSQNIYLDSDGDEEPDVEAKATLSNLKNAVINWSQDADFLLIYMVGPGEKEIFWMSDGEVLWAETLNAWLNELQRAAPKQVALVYDACQSGSFLASLAREERLVAVSAAEDEAALFASGGRLSFGYFFWTHISNGAGFYKAFSYAKESVNLIHGQTPQLDGNGNGIGNEISDQEAALKFSRFTETEGDIPSVGDVSPDRYILADEISARIYAEDVADKDDISEVWAVITPPGYSSDSPEIPVTDLPVVEMRLRLTDMDRYEVVYGEFVEEGTYHIAIFAVDGNNVPSLPKQTTVTRIGNGNLVAPDLWIRAVIVTQEKGNIEGVWRKGGEDMTARGDMVVWGYFYANPEDVTWGSENNPDLFVKIWFDAGGRIDVNYFHVSVPTIEVSSDYPFNGEPDEYGVTTTVQRYIRQYYENGKSATEVNYEDGVPAEGYRPAKNPDGDMTFNDLRIGAVINTSEKGPIDAKWRFGGQDMTARGDQVLWGLFHANPDDVTWGSPDNPDLFVKIWFDLSGRIDVNYFHVSVPDIEVYSDFPADGFYDERGTTILEDRYIWHEFQR